MKIAQVVLYRVREELGGIAGSQLVTDLSEHILDYTTEGRAIFGYVDVPNRSPFDVSKTVALLATKVPALRVALVRARLEARCPLYIGIKNEEVTVYEYEGLHHGLIWSLKSFLERAS